MMKKLYTILFCAILFLNCEHNQTEIKRDGQPTITVVEGDDSDMNEAVEKANETLNEFRTALESHNPDYTFFTLKTRFATQSGDVEHIWIGDVILKDNKYYGVVDNLPENTTEVKLGDTVEVAQDNISDWMYLDHKKLVGGYTIRVLRDRMTRQERKQFDQENDLIID